MRPRRRCVQRRHQLGAERVARVLAGDNEQPQVLPLGGVGPLLRCAGRVRVIGRPTLRLMLSQSRRTPGNRPRSSASRAASSWRPRTHGPAPATATPASSCDAACASSAAAARLLGCARPPRGARRRPPCASAAPLPAQRAPRARAWRPSPPPPRSPARGRARPRRPRRSRRAASRVTTAMPRSMSPASRRLGRRRPITAACAGAAGAAAAPAAWRSRRGHGWRSARVGAAHGLGSGRGRARRRPRPRSPARPAAAALSMVRGPIAGMSTRSSWPGFGPLASTPRRLPAACAAGQAPATRCSMASVPSAPSIASTLPCATTTAWPASSAPERVPHGKADLRVGAILVARARSPPRRPAAGQQIGRHLVGAAHLEAFALEEAHDARQHGIIAAAPAGPGSAAGC